MNTARSYSPTPARWRRTALAVTLTVTCQIAAAQQTSQPARLVPVVTCESGSPNSVLLKLILFNLGRRFDRDGEARLGFTTGDGQAQAYESPAPGPRTVALPLKCASWTVDHVEVVAFGPITFDDSAPRKLHVRGGMVGEPLAALGTLERAEGEHASVVFRRAWIGVEPAAGERRVLVMATGERLGPRRFVLTVAYLNCGERFDKDLSAFIHFDLEPKGEDLDPAIALRLYPSSQKVDTSGWREDELTVVRFGPFEIPREAPEHVYVRAGLYDQFGDGKRLKLAGSDDGTGRVLVGRLVNAQEGVVFARTAPTPQR